MKRPIFLTVWLSLMTIAGVFTLYSYTLGSAYISKSLPTMSSWVLTAFTLLAVVNLVAVTMLWMWKKLGFYITIASAIITASLNGMILGPTGIGGSVLAIIGIGILYLAMKPVWLNFK